VSAEYWATRPTDEIGPVLAEKAEAYFQFVRSSPIFSRIFRAYRARYGVGVSGYTNELTKGGAQGELVKVSIGHFRNLSEHRVTLATQQKPAWQPVATNSDYESVAQASVISGVLDYYYRERRISRYLVQALRDIHWGGEGFVFGGWDARKGETIAADPESGEEVKEGDLFFTNPNALDVVRDPHAESWGSLPWKMVRVWESKWNLAARYPEHAESITGFTKDDFGSRIRSDGVSESDEVPVWHFFHEKSDAIPSGRYVILAGKDTVLFDGPMPYRHIPLFRLVEDELEGTPFGYTAMFDVLGPQEAYDKLTSAILTQQMAHAVRKIVGVKGSGLNYKQLSQGLAYVEVNSMDQKPQTLDFAEVSPQVFQFRDALAGEMQTIASVNDVVRGVVSENIKSGAHAALYDATALRAANALQEAFYQGAEDVGTFVLHSLTDFGGDSERTARIAGESNRGQVMKFTSGTLAGYERVTVEATNHTGKTATGKQAMADALLEKGALGQGEAAGHRYVSFVKTGNLEQLTESPQANAQRLKRDREMLSRGEQPTPVITDPHWVDIPEYLTVLASPEARENPKVVEAVLGVVQAKLEMWRTMDPDLLMLLGGQPAPSTQMMPPPGPGGDMTPPPAPGGPPSPTDSVPPPEPSGVPGGPSLPSLPQNPAVGQPHDPAAGGLA
jgi:hypothetical protein